MNNKEFISKISERSGNATKDVQRLADAFITITAESLDDGNTLSVQGFGNFEVKKKLERVIVNPTTKQRMLVPPKLVLAYKPSPVLKDKLNGNATERH